MRTSIAIYFDLENIESKLNLRKLLEAITLNIEDSTPIFAIKLACGKSEAIANFREQLKNLNFDIREAPQVSELNLKNRADLILTVEAFESLYQKSPDIDLYVFITSDTDFTVIMDKLRKYGKNVWLVTRENEKDKELFTSSSDKILVIEDNFDSTTSEISHLEKTFTDLGFSKNESKSMKEIIESYEKDVWLRSNSFGTKMKNVIKTFSYSGKKVKSQTKLFEKLSEKKIIETKKEGSVDYFKIIK
ncbi:MAG: NYN domain-containing protein [Treponema sp.]|nr:NYN domain-containing protein [Treponema sp.]